MIQQLFKLLFGPKQEKFQIKVVPSWFSDKYARFKYTNNGGWTWHYIKCCDKPFLRDEWYTIGYLTHKIRDKKTISAIKQNYSSYEKIKERHEKTLAYCKSKNIELKKRRKDAALARAKVYEEVNQ